MAGEWRQATEQVATLDEARHLLVTLGDELDAAHREVAALRHRLDRLCRHVFGRRSEQGVPEGQGLLPWPGAAGPIAPDASDADGRPAADEGAAPPLHRRRHPGRRRLPDDLPRARMEIAARPEDLRCPHCTAPTLRLRDEITEGLDYHPASFVIREYVRGVYVCPGCAGAVSQPPLPARPIEKGRPESGLLAHVVTSKYADHRVPRMHTRTPQGGKGKQCCDRDEGGPLDADVQALASNHLTLRGLRVRVVNGEDTARQERVR